MAANDVWEDVLQHARQIALLESIKETLEWDERTYLPHEGGSYRATQVTYLAGRTHQLRTDQRFGEQLEQLAQSDRASDPHSDSGTLIRQLQREFKLQTRLSQRLVEELSEAAMLGQQAWVEARKADKFDLFAPHLTRMLKLKREEADSYGFEDQRYDALLDQFEQNARTKDVQDTLVDLREQLLPLIEAIADAERKPPVELLRRSFSEAAQRQLSTDAASAIGFDFGKGRVDVSEHPFCTTLGPGDCRLTTRFVEQYFPSGFFGTLHEAGHGIYEQGLKPDWFGLPPGQSVSLGIHESQSRLWENIVGRSLPFWKYWFPKVQAACPALQDVTLEEFHFAINAVQPSLVRIEADEATYNLHIIIRFELEQALLDDELKVKDLPEAWNNKYTNYLSIRPDSDARGVLQDIHWSAGLIGYFPTYSLGNLYAAQFFRKAKEEIADLDHSLEVGDFAPLRQWLNQNVHQPGQCFSAGELVERVTGETLQSKYLIEYLYQKLGRLYKLV